MSTKKQLCIGLCLISRQKEDSIFDSGINEQVELAKRAEKSKLDFVLRQII